MQGASVFVYLGHGNGWPSIVRAVPDRDQERPRPRPHDGRRRCQDRLLRRGLPPQRRPARPERRRPPVPPVLRLGQHRTRARRRRRSRTRGSASTTTAAGSSARVRGRSSPRVTPTIRSCTRCASCSRPTGRWRPDLPGSPDVARPRPRGPTPAERTPGPQLPDGPRLELAVGLLPLAHRRPVAQRVEGRRHSGLVRDATPPDRLRGPGRRRGGRREGAGLCATAPPTPPIPRTPRRRRRSPPHAPPGDRRRRRPMADGTRILGVTVLGGPGDGLRARVRARRRATARTSPSGRSTQSGPLAVAQRRRGERRPRRRRAVVRAGLGRPHRSGTPAAPA